MREIRQKEAVDKYRKGTKKLLKAAPRFGKIKVTLDIIERDGYEKILVLYPRKDIKEGWIKDIKKFSCGKDFSFQTFRSAKKEYEKDWDFIVIDEIHEASVSQLKGMDVLIEKCKNVIALSGTVTQTTEKRIMTITGIVPYYEYSISQAVEEGILTDYKIFIHTISLSDGGGLQKISFSKQVRLKEKLEREKKSSFFVDLRLINILQNSQAKLKKTKELLERFKGERILVFCGVKEVADSLGIPVYHSGNKDSEVFKKFCEGDGIDECATIKMAQSGITVLPINKGIINYTSGDPEDTAQKICRFLGFEYLTPDKIAEIHLISSDENFEKYRLNTALSFFDKSKMDTKHY